MYEGESSHCGLNQIFLLLVDGRVELLRLFVFITYLSTLATQLVRGGIVNERAL